MKNMKLIALLVCLTVIVCSLAGCAKTAPISFELNGGTLAGEAPAEFKNDADLALPEPTKQYHRFKGWSLASDGSSLLDGNKLPADMELTDEQVESGLKLYAVWEILTGKITYNLAGGAWEDEDEPGVDSYEYGTKVVFSEDVEREGFAFDHWTLNGQEIQGIDESQEGDIELVAVWEQVDTKITFVLLNDEATLPGAEDIFKTKQGCVLTEEKYIPTAPGYIFSGWYLTEADAKAEEPTTEAISEIEAGTTEPVIVYARWAKAPIVGGENWVPVQ